MGSIRARPQTGKLFFDFRYRGQRCREQTALDDTPANRKKIKLVMQRIDAEITLGTFDYARYFPDSPNASSVAANSAVASETPLFTDFAETWFGEKTIEWRKSHAGTVRLTLNKYLAPTFGEKEVGQITKADILTFRSTLAKITNRKGKNLSAARINHIMTPLRMILNEAANRHAFPSPYSGIKSLKVPRTKVEPFTLDEVRLILETVRPDFKPYYTTRFFTGMRTSEIDGLQWEFVDFKRRQILVHQAWVEGELVDTKTDGSFRAIDMSDLVYNALLEQEHVTGAQAFVFCTRDGTPLSHNNVTKRIWYPLLRHLGLQRRRPYQTRHTAATLWLASGESPEWIANQMGHTTTEMLFRVYSRFVPNLTRQDGSAFERLLRANFGVGATNASASPTEDPSVESNSEVQHEE